MGISNTYVAFCFDEVCVDIIQAIKDDPSSVMFEEDKVDKSTGNRKTFQSEILKR